MPSQVTAPKVKRTFCAGKKCKKHTVHKVTQYKTGKASLYAQGESLSLHYTLIAALRESIERFHFSAMPAACRSLRASTLETKLIG